MKATTKVMTLALMFCWVCLAAQDDAFGQRKKSGKAPKRATNHKVRAKDSSFQGKRTRSHGTNHTRALNGNLSAPGRKMGRSLAGNANANRDSILAPASDFGSYQAGRVPKNESIFSAWDIPQAVAFPVPGNASSSLVLRGNRNSQSHSTPPRAAPKVRDASTPQLAGKASRDSASTSSLTDPRGRGKSRVVGGDMPPFVRARPTQFDIYDTPIQLRGRTVGGGKLPEQSDSTQNARPLKSGLPTNETTDRNIAPTRPAEFPGRKAKGCVFPHCGG